MGCVSSKQIDAAVAVDVYRPAPTSFAVFDINSIQEPWLSSEEQEHDHKPPPENAAALPSPILEKLDAIDEAPRSWDEVKKDLENLKPTFTAPPPTPEAEAGTPSPEPLKKVKRKSFSFHTLEELENNARIASKTKPVLKKTESLTELNKFGTRLPRPDPGRKPPIPVSDTGYKSLKDNPFLLMDIIEREKTGKPVFIKRDPLEDYPELCPPGGSERVVIYTTSLGGVRRTYEDCNRVRSVMGLHGFIYEERDVALHGEFRAQLRELLGDSVSVPRMFVKGRYIGGVDEIVGLNETGRLRRILSRVGIEREVGRPACEGCGGVRFVPCLECGGSRKVVAEAMVGGNKKEKERCSECNENGLMYCPICS